jgi:hypothetical protein
MAIFLGSAEFDQQGNTFLIQPPTGFGSVEAVRISNYTGDALILTNIVGEGSDQQYLMPFQQMVYPFENVRAIPTMTGLQFGDGINTEAVLIEWSSDPDSDFPGTYPVTLTEATFAASTAFSAATTVVGANDQVEITANASAINRTVVNLGAGVIYLGASAGATVPDDCFTLSPGAGITILNNAPIWVTADGTGATFTVIGDHA